MHRERGSAFFANVQVLRAIAASLVVAVHLRGFFGYSEVQDYIFRYGYAGVDLFFVISGFIIVVTTTDGSRSALSFFVSRICRLTPLYYLATFMVFATALVAPSVFKSTSANLVNLLYSLLFVPFEKSPGRIYPVYFLGWTLNYEMFFYALFAGATFLHQRRRALLCSISILMVVVAGAVAGVTDQSNLVLYVYSRPIVLDFVLGMLIGHFQPLLSGRSAIDVRLMAAILVGLALFMIGLIPGFPAATAPNTSTFLTFGIPSACVVLAMVLLETHGYKVKSLHTLGDASYSMYLTHYFVVGALIAVTSRMDLPQVLKAAFAFAVVCGTSVLTFWTIEKPLVLRTRKLLFFAIPALRREPSEVSASASSMGRW
jgi:peptidoglycan/LPS O-acetylase OafA/YrhL